MNNCTNCGHLEDKQVGTECPNCDEGEFYDPDAASEHLPDFEDYDANDPREPYDEHHRDRVLDEVLGDVDAYEASEAGPDGPWRYKSLTLKRAHNTILVIDVDGRLAERLPVEELDVEMRSIREELAKRIESINSETIADL